MITSAEAAERLGISKRGLLKLVERGAITAKRFGNAYVFTPAAVEAAKSRRGRGRPSGKPRSAR